MSYAKHVVVVPYVAGSVLIGRRRTVLPKGLPSRPELQPLAPFPHSHTKPQAQSSVPFRAMAVDSPNNKRKAEEQQPEPVDAKRVKEVDEASNSPSSPSEPVAATVNTTTVIQSSEQFHKIVVDDKFTVASFFAPWCGGCKTAAPHVAKLAEELTDVVRL